MKFNQGEIAEIYGYKWEDINEGKRAYLRGKLKGLNDATDLKNFYGNLDLRNQKNFKRVVKKKLGWLL